MSVRNCLDHSISKRNKFIQKLSPVGLGKSATVASRFRESDGRKRSSGAKTCRTAQSAWKVSRQPLVSSAGRKSPASAARRWHSRHQYAESGFPIDNA